MVQILSISISTLKQKQNKKKHGVVYRVAAQLKIINSDSALEMHGQNITKSCPILNLKIWIRSDKLKI